jgi:hypothetical protein
LKALKPQGPEEELSKYLPSLADEFFGLIITIISARYTVGVGQVNKTIKFFLQRKQIVGKFVPHRYVNWPFSYTGDET